MLSEDASTQLESIIRRVIREELAVAWRATQSQPHRTQPSPHPRSRRVTIEDERESMENMRIVDEYLKQIDPAGYMSREETLQAIRFRFPRFGV